MSDKTQAVEVMEKLKELLRNNPEALSMLKRSGITRKGIKEIQGSEQMLTLQTKANDLMRQAGELEKTVVPPEVMEAKVRRFDRMREDALADGKVERAGKIEEEKNQFLQERAKALETIRDLNTQAQAVDRQIKALFPPFFFESFRAIKTEVERQLTAALDFAKSEIDDFIALREEYGVKLPFDPRSEIRIFPEGKSRTVRERLADELLP